MYTRRITNHLLKALADTPVVVLQGARQTGKSTLAQMIANTAHPAQYLTMDNVTVLASAQSDPVGFLEGLRNTNVILDEIQRAPELLLSLKAEVDRRRTPGRFLLTGSANAMLLPRLADSLVGRMELITLYPLAQSEIAGSTADFITSAFRSAFATRQLRCDRQDIIRRALRGGYPEVLNRVTAGSTEDRLTSWFDSYITTILQRDVRDLANIQGINELPLLLRLIAARATAALNIADLSRGSRIANVTLSRYLSLLQATFLIHLALPWSSNLSSRLVKSPKLLMMDTGVLSFLNGWREEQVQRAPTTIGPLIENFVGMELLKLASWHRQRPQLHYFRTHDRLEVDFVLQAQSGKVVGIEVKASSTIDAGDFKGLRALAELAGSAFACGIVLYTGENILPFGKHLFAVPISALWEAV